MDGSGGGDALLREGSLTMGDQDLLTAMMRIDPPAWSRLWSELPCEWNWQLCLSW